MPSFVARDAFLLALAMPFVRKIASAFSRSPFASVKRAFAIHHTGVGFFAELLNEFGIDFHGQHVKWLNR